MPDRICCAPSAAARQTAEALGLGLVLGLVVEPEIRDCDYGRWSGRPLVDVARDEPEAFTAWMTDPDSRPHGGESRADLLLRVGGWVDSLRQEQGRTTLAVTHPAVIRAAIVHAIEATPATFWHLDVGPLSRARLRSDGRRWALRSLQA
jgi:broad specificity phosphatase PhoE